MKTVYIFGAGASRACASRTPTTKEIFARAKEIGGRSAELLGEIAPSIGQRFGISEAALLSGEPDFERIFTLVASDREMTKAVGSVEQQSRNATTEIALESLIYELLMTVTGDEVQGGKTLYDEAITYVGDEDEFISFNYDLLLYSALERSGRWWPVDGYGFGFHRFQDSDGNQLSSEAHSQSTWRLWKLHGSLNWFRMNGLYGHASGMSWEVDFSREHKDKDVVVSTKSRAHVDVFGTLDVRYVDGPKKFQLDVNIIPPILAKEVSSRFPAIWQQAQQSISLAGRVVVIGYSLPLTDFSTEWLFRTAVCSRDDGSLCVDVVNPDKSVVERISKLFGPKARSVTHFTGFEQFVAKNGKGEK